MNLGKTLAMAIKSINNNKVRSFLTMLGIVIGVSSVIIMVSLAQGLQNQVKKQFESMGTNRIMVNYWSNRDLTDGLYDFCLSMDDLVEGVTPNSSNWFDVKYQKKTWQTNVYFGSDKYDVCNNYELEAGSMITNKQVQNRSRVAVIGSAVKKELFNYIDPIGKTIRIKGQKYTVIGVFKEKAGGAKYEADDMVLVPYTNNRALLGSTQINNFTVRAKSSKSTNEAIEKLRGYLSTKFSNEWDYNVYSFNEAIEQSNQVTQIISLVLGGIAGISLIVGGIGIMNIMLVSVTERTREIGIRKAIGAKRRDIIMQFLIESGTVSVLGGAIGIAFGGLVTLILGKLFFDMVILPNVFITIGAVLFSMLIGVFFGFYPANRASKLNPIDALRQE
ncbi:ABC transporter permease [Feifania hominis]|uniref:ABC transporter permease n=1 Tax=Feifania hominis TaxID=2763660 RepID=A0A926DBP4_9FIRM|nr:ABC transporter permease [Feifania hominis]MBC8536020.1 ABC transporter permease [Feifania hominis]